MKTLETLVSDKLTHAATDFDTSYTQATVMNMKVQSSYMHSLANTCSHIFYMLHQAQNAHPLA